MLKTYPLNPISFSAAKAVDHAAIERGDRRVLTVDDLHYIAQEMGLAPLEIIKIARAIGVVPLRRELVPRFAVHPR
jgi:hypothetical protein